MKLNVGKRILLFIYWVASLAVAAALALPQYTAIIAEHASEWLTPVYAPYAWLGLLAIYLLLSLSVACMVFHRADAKRADRGFVVVDSADTGKVRIAIGAIEQMVKQAAQTVDGVSDMKIVVTNAEDTIDIRVNVTMLSGAHVPTVTLGMQRAIRQFVEMNCGVSVQSVSINIQAVTNPAESAKRGKRREWKASEQPEAEMSVVSAPVQIEYASAEAEIREELPAQEAPMQAEIEEEKEN